MDCITETTQQFDLTSLQQLIEDSVDINNLYGITTTLPTTDLYDELQTVSDNNIYIHTWNSGLNSFTSASSLLHVGQENFDAGYEACKRLKTLYNASKILILDSQFGNNMGLVSRGLGCQDYIGYNNTKLLYIPGTNIEAASASIISQLVNDTSINAILATDVHSEESSNFALTSMDSLNMNVGNFVGIAAFDYNQLLLEHIVDNTFTKFSVNQQAYLQGFLPIYWLGIKATTKNSLIYPHSKIASGPQFINADNDEALQQIALLECASINHKLYFCDDDEEYLSDLPDVEGCDCINSSNKQIYLFHHGSISNDFYSILTSGAEVAANDINITLNIVQHYSETLQMDLDGFQQLIEDTLQENAANNIKIDGIITTIPNQEINGLYQDINIPIIGIADSYNTIVNSENENVLIFVGQNDETAGYDMSDLLYNNLMDNNRDLIDSYLALICLNSQFETLVSLTERCSGVARYCQENNLEYRIVYTVDENVDGSISLISDELSKLKNHNTNITAIGIVATAESSCMSAMYACEDSSIKALQFADISLGCFDGTDAVLDGLLQHNVAYIFDQQPWLIGYTSVLLLSNKLFLNEIPATLLIETGPKLIKYQHNDDLDDIYIKQCENYYLGYEFCPENGVILQEININFATMANFGGILIVILFIFSMVISIFIFIMMYILRDDQVFLTFLQIDIMIITIVGGCIMMMSGLLTIHPSGSDINVVGLTTFHCNYPWLIFSFGFTLFFFSYSLRVWKFVNLIENGLSLRTRFITRKEMLIKLFVVVVIDFILNIIAIQVQPIHVETYIETVENDSYVTELTNSYCYGHGLGSIWIVSIIYKVLLLLWTISVALRKQISSEKLKKLRYLKQREGSNITVGIYMIVVSFVIYLFLSFIVNRNTNSFTPIVQWTAVSFLSFLCYITVLVCVLFNRFMNSYKRWKLKTITGNMKHKVKDVSRSFADILSDPHVQRVNYLITEATEAVMNDNFTAQSAQALETEYKTLQKQFKFKLSATVPSSHSGASLELQTYTATNGGKKTPTDH